MKKVMIASVLLFSVASVLANTPATKKAAPAKPIQSWTCEDFLVLDETYRPTAIKTMEIINEKSSPNDVYTDDIYIDIDGIETVTPEIVETCKANPKTPFTQTVKTVKAKHAVKK